MWHGRLARPCGPSATVATAGEPAVPQLRLNRLSHYFLRGATAPAFAWPSVARIIQSPAANGWGFPPGRPQSEVPLDSLSR